MESIFNAIGSYMTADMAIFVTIQLVNVIVATIKSVVTVNGGKMSASVFNAISYTLGAVVTKMLTQQEFEVIIVVSVLTNLFGTWLGKWILERTRKERFWTITGTLRTPSRDYVEGELLRRGVQYTLVPAMNDRMLITTFAHSKGESSIVKEIFAHEGMRYTITENL